MNSYIPVSSEYTKYIFKAYVEQNKHLIYFTSSIMLSFYLFCFC